MWNFSFPNENILSLHQVHDTIISNQIKDTYVYIRIHIQTWIMHEWILGLTHLHYIKQQLLEQGVDNYLLKQ